MSVVEVLGRDAGAEAYRVRAEGCVALVPEFLMESLRPGARPSHQDAYRWIAAHRRAIARAVAELSRGETPNAPFDVVTLTEEGS